MTDFKPDNITRDCFLQYRSPKRGETNPHPMTNAVWEYLIRTRLSAYHANELFGGPSWSEAQNPCWCFDRYGQSETQLPDGRTLYIAGEHEDYYDPDFYIYNDVVFVDSSGSIEILGYPVNDFPPTDFHTATLTGGSIFLIGNLGYPQDRKPQQTQVLQLEIDTWKIRPVFTTGKPPGWIHKHQAVLSSDGREIIITKGLLYKDSRSTLIENIDDWALDIATLQWKRLTCRQWQRFEFYRKDKDTLHLFDLERLFFDKKYGIDTSESERKLKDAIGYIPDRNLLETLFAPAATDETIARDGDDFRTHRIRIGGVIVRYVENSGYIQMTVEGQLPDIITEQLKNDMSSKLTALEGTDVVCCPIVSD